MQISQTKDIRTVNKLTVIRHILDKKEISRARISDDTNLNKATVSTIVKEWIDLKLVKETSTGDSIGGRRPINLTLNSEAGFCIGVDVGVSEINLILVNLNNEIIKSLSFKIKDSSFTSVYKQLINHIDELKEYMPISSYGLIGIGLAIRGVIDLEGVIRFIPKLAWHNIDLKSLLIQRYKVPIYIDNDGDLASLMEYRLYPEHKEITYLSISDVISCGQITNGKLIRGYLGFASAIGHHTINRSETRQCSCGKYGCFEQYCSESALIDDFNKTSNNKVKSIDAFIKLVKAQDKVALKVLSTYINNLAIGLSNIIFFTNSELIIVNSKLLRELPYLLPEIVKVTVLPITHSQELVLSKYGDRGPILGASRSTIEQFFSNMAEK